ncbi:MAG: formylglycine-generating enzyme family protein [Kiritimatiellia bacterium]|nr:formylglycine-generating enzyme family protein [Kiritimatiellia bacterium]
MRVGGIVVCMLALVMTGAVFSAPNEMVKIPGGSNSGTNPLDEGEFYTDGYPEKHDLKVADFYMDKYEVAKAKWDEVATWAKDKGYDIGPDSVMGKAPDHPVYMVSWYEAVKWCNARSEKEGIKPAYYTSRTRKTVYREGELNVEDNCVDWTTGYRLPTSEEWEYAARGGDVGKRFPWGTDSISHSNANYCAYIKPEYDASGGKRYHPAYMAKRASPFTNPVGAFEKGKNKYGLYDMAGNLQEWCWSWHAKWPGSHRVLRGSSWDFHTANCRAGQTLSYLPGSSYYSLGFRTCMSIAGKVTKAIEPAAAEPPASKPASPGTLTIAVIDAEGKTIKESGTGVLEIERQYAEGDQVVVSGAENMAIRVDECMLEAIVYSPGKKVSYPIPLWTQGAYGNNPTKYTAYPRRPPPQAFMGEKHIITARVPSETEIYSYRNVACNPMDKRDWRDPEKDGGGRMWPEKIADDMFPHAVSNSEWRHSCIYAARNAIDGHVDSTGNHHGWPRQNWGPYANAGGEAQTGQALRVNFGRPVEIDKLGVLVRYNPYQNNHFKNITVEFSDGSSVQIEPKYHGERQGFPIEKRTVEWMNFTKLIDQRPGGYAALGEVEAWGKPAR